MSATTPGQRLQEDLDGYFSAIDGAHSFDAESGSSTTVGDMRKLLALVEAAKALQETFLAPNRSWAELVQRIMAVSEATFTITTSEESHV